MFEYKVTGKLAGRGRTGIFTTPHGDIQTPVFMPVGTHASVKSVNPTDLEKIKAQIILANNYHLFLRPGSDIIAKMGGLHSFMNWDHPILTDSGGFQVWSLKGNTSPDGVEFRSHLDGSLNFLSPEIAIDSEAKLGADIIMAFDQCTKDTATVDEARAAVELTQNWLLRSIKEWKKHDPGKQALFGIIQGALHEDIRREATQFVVDQDTPGIALGGETIGFNMAGTKQVVDWIADLLPENKPRYTMGLGLKPSDVLSAITLGIDMFDCVAPTRLARNGALYTGKVVIKNVVGAQHGAPEYHFESEFTNERINIGNKQFETDGKPIDPDCDCDTCHHFTRAYLHHLFHTKELLYYSLASIHNLRMMTKTVEDAIALSSK
ncbi:tRNA guanosine(34) transglycosylase Tgt [Candidatus Collierbacteria bacterium]|nr:tRNA guanosine(34) transglycosylase Tgt [Candidatus Collierbacteria bacterium]